MSCSTSTCGCGGCGCDQCRPANTIYRATCTDPGTITYGTYLYVLDAQFCPNRLEGGEGIVQSRVDGSGNFRITVTESPQVDLPTLQAVTGTAIPNLVVIDSNDFWHELLGPATASLVLMTNAAGQLRFTALPAATVPDPLTIGTVNVTTALTSAALTVTGATTLSGVAAGTITGVLGVNAANLVVTQTLASLASACAMFFEAPTSPSATTPNSPATAGNNLIIGNLIFDSGLTLINVTTSQTLTVAVAGAYTLEWVGQVTWTGGSSGRPSLNLLINGIVVNYANSRDSNSATVTTNQRSANIAGIHALRMAVGDTIQIQLGTNASTNVNVFELRLVAKRLTA